MVAHFRVQQLLGAGGMGVVYLARDTRLGRPVALKCIHPSRVEKAGSSDAFLEEMRLTARLNHPHVVQVYDVGQDGGVPWAALEYLEGRTLRDVLRAERMSVGRVMRVGLGVALALEAAHAAGILHLDLKPENILLPLDGRPRVVDFGLSRARGSGGASGGTPGYMAPEQWDVRETTEAADLWALGVVLFEALAGFHPYDDGNLDVPALRARLTHVDQPVLPNEEVIPTELAQLVRLLLSAEGTRRPPAARVALTLGALLSGKSALDEGEAPFRGLLAFHEVHAGQFFGRDEEISALVERLRQEPMIPVLGASGAGKSSLVMAGLIPRLREDAYWIVLSLRPGRDPLRALAAALVVKEGSSIVASYAESNGTFSTMAWEEPEETPALPAEPSAGQPPERDPALLLARLSEAPGSLAVLLAELAERHRCRVLLFVDQLEEVFTLAESEERALFLSALARAADAPREPVRVLFTLRDDFLGELAAHAEMRRAIHQVVVVRAPEPHALFATLVRPLERAGYRFESDEIATEMVASVGTSAAALPMLQFAARALWERRDTSARVLTRVAYREMGGVEGALARHADGVLGGLTGPQLAAARALTRRLVTPEGTRRTMTFEDAVSGLDAQGELVLERLVSARLVTSAGEAPRVVELAHESLIRQWRQLALWLDESREERHLIHEVEEAARKWDRSGQRASDCWQGDALRDVDPLLRGGVAMTAVASAFLEASLQKRDSFQRRRRWIMGVGGLVLAAVTLGSAAAAVAFAMLQQDARAAARVALAAQAEALAASAQLHANSGNFLKARELLVASVEVGDTLQARALMWALSRQPVLWSQEVTGPYFAAYHPDGTRIYAAAAAGQLRVIDPMVGLIETWGIGNEEVALVAVAVTPDGREVVALDHTGVSYRWSLAHPEQGPTRGPAMPPGPYWWRLFQVLPNGDLLGVRLTASREGEAIVLGERGARVTPLGPIYSVATLHPQGEWLFTAARDGGVQATRLRDGETRRMLRTGAASLEALDFSEDGRLLYGMDEALHRWAVRWDEAGAPVLAEEVVSPVPGARAEMGVALPGGRWAWIDINHQLFVWDVAQMRPLWTLREVARQPLAHLLAQNDHLFFIQEDGLVSLDASRTPVLREGHTATVDRMAVSADGGVLAAGGVERALTLVDTQTGTELAAERALPSRINGLEPRADGILAVGFDDQIQLWSMRPWVRRGVLPADSTATGLAWRGDTLRVAEWEGVVRSWNLADFLVGRGSPTWFERMEYRHRIFDLAFSPDGRTEIVAGHLGHLHLRAGGEDRELAGHVDGVTRVRAAASGFVTTSYDKTVIYWDLSGNLVRRWADTHETANVALSADGRVAAWCYEDRVGSVLLPEARPRTWAIPYLVQVAVSPDGGQLYTATRDGNLMRWDRNTGAPLWKSIGMNEHYQWTHEGVMPVLGGAPPRALPQEAWAGDLRGDTWCGVMPDRDVERRGPQGVTRAALSEVAQVVALDDGCLFVTHTGGLWALSEELRLVGEGATWVASEGARGLALRAGAWWAVDADGAAQSLAEADPDATAALRWGDGWVIGDKFGNTQLRTGGHSEIWIRAEEIGEIPVVRLAASGDGLFGVARADGTVELWTPGALSPLAAMKLQGKPVHLGFSGTHLWAGTDAGQRGTLPLEIFRLSPEALRDTARREFPSHPVGGSE